MAATSDLPGSTYVGPGGPGEVRGIPQVVGTSRLARDPEAARRFWEVAQQATASPVPDRVHGSGHARARCKAGATVGP
jgi:hypothetical protein